MATFGTSRDDPQVKVEDPEEENAAEEEDEEDDSFESLSREFSRGAWREQVDEERMAESLKKMNENLDEVDDGCEKLYQSLEGFEETTIGLEPRIERMFGKWAAAAGSDRGKTPLVSEVRSLAEHEESLQEPPYEEDDQEVVETEKINEEKEEGSGTDETLNERDVSAAELYRTVRESAPSPEPLPHPNEEYGRFWTSR